MKIENHWIAPCWMLLYVKRKLSSIFFLDLTGFDHLYLRGIFLKYILEDE